MPLFYDTSCFDVIVPGLLMVTIEVIGMYFGLKVGCQSKSPDALL